MPGGPIMSMESALDEERLAVLELLEGQANRTHRNSAGSAGSAQKMRSSSPFTTNPRSPTRSMLDIAEKAVPRSAFVASTNTGMTQVSRTLPIRSMLDVDSTPRRSMLDIDSPPRKSKVDPESQGMISRPVALSAQSSPTEYAHKVTSTNLGNSHPRSQSDASTRPRPSDPVQEGYQFSGFLPSNPGGPVVPKRNTLGGKRPAGSSAAMVAAMRGEEVVPILYGQKDRERNTAMGSALVSRDSKSPHNRIGLRSSSPALTLPSKTYTLDSGTVVDMSSAYRRLSDANLALSGGSLAGLSSKVRQGKRGSDPGISHQGRLEKDYSFAEDDVLAESSEDDHQHSSDGERRGRSKSGKSNKQDAEDNPESHTVGMGRAKGPRQAKSLMAAAEEERQQIAAKQAYKVRSLLEPEITVTGPSGSELKSTKSTIHPSTAFDQGGISGNTSAMNSDTDADIGDVRREQQLALIMTPIQSTPESQRCVRTIFRGDFAKTQEEAKENTRNVRKYLVATDLSDEAQYALEWTVGTVIRDGDTLLAIYCVDEEIGIANPDNPAQPISSSAADKESITAQAVSVAAATNKASQLSTAGVVLRAPSPLAAARSVTRSAQSSQMGRERKRAEQERFKAVESITERVVRLLRKTRLQVRVVIEVIHCKSPKHLITEVIDFLDPTLVILGSRGRSALKGVILGSFSNYLVTKSSVPVMVARKRLRKHTKYKRPPVRLANNLTSNGFSGLNKID